MHSQQLQQPELLKDPQPVRVDVVVAAVVLVAVHADVVAAAIVVVD